MDTFFISIRGGTPHPETITSFRDITKIDPSYIPLVGDAPTDPLTSLEISIANDGARAIATCTATPLTLEQAKAKAIVEAKRIASGLIEGLIAPYSAAEAISWTQKEAEARIPTAEVPVDALLYVECGCIFDRENPGHGLEGAALDAAIREKLAQRQASVLEKAALLRNGHGAIKAVQQSWESAIKSAPDLDAVRSLVLLHRGATLQNLGLAPEEI